MPDLELTRTAGDRRLHALEGVGTLRFEAIDPGLLLFAVFVTRALAEDASGAAVAATSGATTAG